MERLFKGPKDAFSERYPENPIMNKVIPTPEEVAGQLYLDHFGVPPDSVTALPISGSDRRYYRLAIGKQTAIATFNANVAENNTYFYFTELFRKHGVPVPEVY